jgi:hypothetical protein
MEDDAYPGQMGSSGPATHPGNVRKTGTEKVKTGHLVRFKVAPARSMG